MTGPDFTPSGRIILASDSAARASLLRAAGVVFAVEPAAIDESAIKREAQGNGATALDAAIVLAIEKACAVSRGHRDSLVIGADQLLASGADWFDKPCDLS